MPRLPFTYRSVAVRSHGLRSAHRPGFGFIFSPPSTGKTSRFAPAVRELSSMVPRITVADSSVADQPIHVRQVSEKLEQGGILKISLGFADPGCQYLEQLIKNLHAHQGHNLPISHSASCGWFWDVRPKSTNFQSANHQARSETMEDFPWHTDCSYEHLPPRYFALQVLQHDRYGGGTLSVMSVDRLSQLLSPETRSALMRPEYRIAIPTEFIKDPTQSHLRGSLLTAGGTGRPSMMRFREDLLTPLSQGAADALDQLKRLLRRAEAQESFIVHLTAEDLPAGSIILIDNRRWLHARNHVKDPARHLRRVRWDAVPFPLVSN